MSAVASEVPTRPPEGSAEPPTRGRHLYSAGYVNRVNFVGAVGTIAAIVATGAGLLLALPFPHLGTQASAWGGVVIATVLAAGMFAGFEKRAWRWRLTASIPSTTVPDLSGKWTDHLLIPRGKEGEDVGVPLDCRVDIKQDWSRITVELETDLSTSWSVMATVDARKTGADVEYELHYEYYVNPRSDPPSDLAAKVELVDPHYGSARLKLGPGPWPRVRPTLLDGIWYNDQHFELWGTIAVARP